MGVHSIHLEILLCVRKGRDETTSCQKNMSNLRHDIDKFWRRRNNTFEVCQKTELNSLKAHLSDHLEENESRNGLWLLSRFMLERSSRQVVYSL